MSTAEDLTQDVFVRLTKLTPTKEIKNPEAYLMQTASSVWNDHWRKRKVRNHDAHVEYEDLEHPNEELSPSLICQRADSVDQVLAALNALEVRTKHIFVLRRFEGMTQKEVAKRMGVSMSLVEKEMMRAIAHITEWFGNNSI